mmetsp:Transcript_25542/g.64902  ORF Transcript_25542/g.64902 Transcript_25542/m.64902 type:complete len:89 (+) Transcript_25542:23-289(+)
MVNSAKDLVLIECDIPTKVFIQKVSEDLCEQGRGHGPYGRGSLVREDLDETHLLVHRDLLEPLREQMDKRSREHAFDRDRVLGPSTTG